MLRYLIFTGCFASSALFAVSSIGWVSDYQEAVEMAKQEEKPILLFFTGSDWSGWGMKMKKEILDTPQFAEKVADHFVCVEVDFPKHKRLPAEESEQNTQLKERMEISEYPRLILLDCEEREIARLGYTAENGEQLGRDLLEVVQRDQQMNQIMKALDPCDSALEEYYRIAQELQRFDDASRILEVGLKSSDPLFFQLEKYRLFVEEGRGETVEAVALREQLIKRDPTNAHSVHFTLALIDFQHLSNQERSKEEIIKPLEAYLSKFGNQDTDNVWRVEMMIAQFYLNFDECATALKHAETALKTAPLEMRNEIEHSLDYIREQVGSIVSSSS